MLLLRLFNLLTILENLRPTPYKPGFEIFGIEIRFYAIIILSGAVIATLYGYLRFGKKLGLTSDLVLEGLALGLLFGIIGARLYYVLFEHENLDNFWDIINPRSGGLAIHGAIFSTAIYVPIYCKIKKIDILTLIEIVVPLFMFAQVVGRWGNFMNQEAFGPLIDSIGGLTKENLASVAVSGTGTIGNPYILSDEILLAQRDFMHKCLIPDFIVNQMYIEDGWILINGETIYISGYYHPTFLYESLMNLAFVIFMLVGRKHIKKYYIGDSIGIYLISYGIVRFIIESLRTDPLTIGNTNIRIAQVMSVLFVIGGIVLLILRRVFKYRLVSCHEMFYEEGHTVMLEKMSENKAPNQEVKTIEETETKENIDEIKESPTEEKEVNQDQETNPSQKEE